MVNIMGLNINSPAYYTSRYGIVDEIYRMCYNIMCGIDITNYTNSFDSIGIIPIIAPVEEIDKGRWKEVKKVLVGSKLAIISLHINYDVYCAADVSQKKELVLRNIFESLMVIKKKIKNDFNYEQLEIDILKLVQQF